MKKFLLALLIVFAGITASAQTYFSKTVVAFENYDDIYGKTSKCNFRFVIDTTAKVMTATDLDSNRLKIIFLVEKHFLVIENDEVRTWGYKRIEASGGLDMVSFTETLAGELVTVNFYFENKQTLMYYVEKPKPPSL